MNETWITFLAGAGWLIAFITGLFAFANHVQRRERLGQHPQKDHATPLIPVSEDHLAALDELAAAAKVPTSEVASRALSAGIASLRDRTTIVLTEREAERIVDLIDNPRPPSPEYLEAKRRHQKIKARGQHRAQGHEQP